jgi:hypothetical protein
MKNGAGRWECTTSEIVATDSILGRAPSAYTGRIGFWTIDGDTLRWVGVVLFAVGCVLRPCKIEIGETRAETASEIS